MRIADIKILNFRKLEEVSVDLRGDTTVFIERTIAEKRLQWLLCGIS